MPGKRLFFVTYGGAHVQMLLPVIRQAQACGHDTTVLGLTTAIPVLRQAGIETIGFADLLQDNDGEAIAIGKRLIDDLPAPPENLKESIAYLGLSYMDLQRRLGSVTASKLYHDKKRQCFEPVSVLERTLIHYQPDLVITTSSPRAEKAAIMAAHKLGIRSVALIDLFGRFTDWASDPNYASKLLVFSSITRDFFIQHGRRPDDIIITGNPAMDRLADRRWSQQALAWRSNKGWEKNPIIFWASHEEPSPNTALPSDIDHAITTMLAKQPDWRGIFRFHPSEIPRLTESTDIIHYSPKQEDLTPLLYACDLCIVINSTVGLEAAMIEKPLITMNMSSYTHYTPYAKYGISSGVNHLNELEPLAVKLLERGSYRRPALPPLGGSTDRVIAVINDLLAGK
jgi:hypothetical protein